MEIRNYLAFTDLEKDSIIILRKGLVRLDEMMYQRLRIKIITAVGEEF